MAGRTAIAAFQLPLNRGFSTLIGRGSFGKKSPTCPPPCPPPCAPCPPCCPPPCCPPSCCPPPCCPPPCPPCGPCGPCPPCPPCPPCGPCGPCPPCPPPCGPCGPCPPCPPCGPCPPCPPCTPPPAARHAMEVLYCQHGDPQHVLTDRCEPLRRPLQHNEVLVKMMLAPVNPLDLDVICGRYFECCRLPAFAGNEGVGQVLEVGCSVRRFCPGNWVIPADFGLGTWRSQLICDENYLSCIPNDLPVVGAAAISVAPCTAYRLLKNLVHLCPCDVVIQSAANGAIGQAVIQLCNKWGIHTVNVVRDRPNVNDVVQHLKKLGATHVITDKFLESNQMANFIKALKKKPRLAIDCVGGKIANNMARHLDPCGGVFATYGDLSCDPCAFQKCGLDIRPVKVYGFWRTQWCCDNNACSMESVLMEMCSYMKCGALRPLPCDIYTLLRYREAAFKTREPFKGKKLILKLDENLKVPPCEFCK